MASAQDREHAQCWNGTHVLPRYGFLKVNTLYPDIKGEIQKSKVAEKQSKNHSEGHST
jgi:hypothetical protein